MSCLESKKCNQPCPMKSSGGCWLKLWTRRQRWVLVFLVLALVAFLSVGAAVAESWVAKNKSGGEIVMTEEPCPDDSGKWFAYYYNADSSSMYGCYTSDGDVVHVKWADGRTNVYKIHIFKGRKST